MLRRSSHAAEKNSCRALRRLYPGLGHHNRWRIQALPDRTSAAALPVELSLEDNAKGGPGYGKILVEAIAEKLPEDIRVVERP